MVGCCPVLTSNEVQIIWHETRSKTSNDLLSQPVTVCAAGSPANRADRTSQLVTGDYSYFVLVRFVYLIHIRSFFFFLFFELLWSDLVIY